MKRLFIITFLGLVLGGAIYVFFLANYSPEQSSSTTSLSSNPPPELTSTIIESEVESENVTAQMHQTKQPFFPKSVDTTKEALSPEPSASELEPPPQESVAFSEGQIWSLTQGTVVTRRQPLSGSITHFDANQYYFLIIQSQHFGQLHYPQQELLSADWEVTGIYGSINQKYGYRYSTFVVQTSEAETAQIIAEAMRSGKGLSELPSDTMIITEKVTVVCCQ